jgi:hypothetical protein
LGNGDDQDDEEPGAGEYRVGQDAVTSVTLRRGSSWLQDLALDSLETSAGIVGGWSSLALPCPSTRRSMRNLVGTASLVGPE